MFSVRCLIFVLAYNSGYIFKGLFGYEIESRYLSRDKNFTVYWNVPSFQCRSHKFNFSVLMEKYGIVANSHDDFNGDKVVILYDPGSFPAYLKDSTTGKLKPRNGIVPQAGNLTLHLQHFRESIDRLIPDENFSGIAIIDFESWRPIFRQNWGTLVPYKDYSKDLVRQHHPFWTKSMIEKEATLSFERWARIFMLEALLYAKDLRPWGKWGYYHYPYCFNMYSRNMQTDCSREVQKENERIEWLFGNSDILYPSVYLSEKDMTSKQRMQMIEGRVREATRVAGYSLRGPFGPKILPYYWYVYRDTDNYVTKEDLYQSIWLMKKLEADGMVIWGSSSDVNSKRKCQNLYDYVDNVLGPIIMSS